MASRLCFTITCEFSRKLSKKNYFITFINAVKIFSHPFLTNVSFITLSFLFLCMDINHELFVLILFYFMFWIITVIKFFHFLSAKNGNLQIGAIILIVSWVELTKTAKRSLRRKRLQREKSDNNSFYGGILVFINIENVA